MTLRGATLTPILLALLTLTTACPRELDAPPDLVFSEEPAWPVRTHLPPLEDGVVFVTNSMEDTVSVFALPELSGPAPREALRLPLGLSPVELEGPHHAAVDPQGRFFYVPLSENVPGAGSGPHGAHGTGTADGAVVKVDARTGLRLGSARLDRSPGDILVSPDGRTLYVSHYDLRRIQDVLHAGGPVEDMVSRLAVLDTETMERRAMVPLCPAAHGMALSPDGTRLYVSCLSDEVAEVDLTQGSFPVRKVGLGPGAGTVTTQHEPYALAVSPTTGEVWVSCQKGRDVHVLTPDPLTVDGSRRLTVGLGLPLFGELTRDGSALFLPIQAPDRVLEVDPATATVRRTINLPHAACTNAHQLRLLPTGTDALVVCEGDRVTPGTLVVLDVAAGTVRRSVPVGLFPDYVGILREGTP
ncbi:MAG: YncE family protein [Myxococcaceae bacterium]|nr:YncE family protein [Myxococcaceae bacterium]MCI0673474.1 YncE family protein [Myxococcaceae bacterium]